MKYCSLIFLLIHFFQQSYSQINGIVVEKGTGKPVPYAGISLENQNISVSSKEDGTFIIDRKDLRGKFLVVTSLAYETQRVEINDKLRIELVPVVYQLREAVINAKTKRIKSENWAITYIAKYPYMFASYYPYLDNYDQTPYLQEISFGIGIHKDINYRFRVWSVNEKGEPGIDLIPNKTLFTVKEGSHVLNAGIEKYHIKIPKNGFFVGFEIISEKDEAIAVDLAVMKYNDKTAWTYINGLWSNEPWLASPNGTSFFKAQFRITLSK